MFEIVPALVDEKGPLGESREVVRSIIIELMRPYNMHHIPSEEMEELDLSCFYLALDREQNKYLGACGYKMLKDGSGKTTLLSVPPEFKKQKVGLALQQTRVAKMKSLGAKWIITNADRPESIEWYKKQGYYEIGKLPKIHSFGLDDVDHWTTIRLDLC